MSAAEPAHLQRDYQIRLMVLAKLGANVNQLFGRCVRCVLKTTEMNEATTVESRILSLQPEPNDVLRLGIEAAFVHLENIRHIGPSRCVYPKSVQVNWLVFVPARGWLLELNRSENRPPEWYHLNRNLLERFDDPTRYIPVTLELL